MCLKWSSCNQEHEHVLLMKMKSFCILSGLAVRFILLFDKDWINFSHDFVMILRLILLLILWFLPPSPFIKKGSFYIMILKSMGRVDCHLFSDIQWIFHLLHLFLEKFLDRYIVCVYIQLQIFSIKQWYHRKSHFI